jgi:hypothetical protein
MRFKMSSTRYNQEIESRKANTSPPKSHQASLLLYTPRLRSTRQQLSLHARVADMSRASIFRADHAICECHVRSFPSESLIRSSRRCIAWGNTLVMPAEVGDAVDVEVASRTGEGCRSSHDFCGDWE